MAVRRKARGLSQVALARRAGISVSLLSKVEVGDRALTQGIAAALACAMGLRLDELLGTAPVAGAEEQRLGALSHAVRRFDIPGPPSDRPEDLPPTLAQLNAHRYRTELRAVLSKLPDLLTGVTNHTHATGPPDAWSRVADAYSLVYWLAARHRWMHLAELAVLKQRLAAERAQPVAVVVAAHDEAGAFLDSGDFAGGLAIVDRAVVEAESVLEGPERAFGLGILHLRGLTPAGRVRDKAAAKAHLRAAWRSAEAYGADRDAHSIHFGPDQTATHAVATYTDLDEHRRALATAEDPLRGGTTLPPTRIGPLHMNLGRSHLALGDRDGALTALEAAWAVAPEMARVHPTSQELLRVLTSLHRRSNPRLTALTKRAGIRS